MPVNLSIKNVPDKIAEELRERAARNHSSLRGEWDGPLHRFVVLPSF
jgi:plasmid stability protein